MPPPFVVAIRSFDDIVKAPFKLIAPVPVCNVTKSFHVNAPTLIAAVPSVRPNVRLFQPLVIKPISVVSRLTVPACALPKPIDVPTDACVIFKFPVPVNAAVIAGLASVVIFNAEEPAFNAALTEITPLVVFKLIVPDVFVIAPPIPSAPAPLLNDIVPVDCEIVLPTVILPPDDIMLKFEVPRLKAADVEIAPPAVFTFNAPDVLVIPLLMLIVPAPAVVNVVVPEDWLIVLPTVMPPPAVVAVKSFEPIVVAPLKLIAPVPVCKVRLSFHVFAPILIAPVCAALPTVILFQPFKICANSALFKFSAPACAVPRPIADAALLDWIDKLPDPEISLLS